MEILPSKTLSGRSHGRKRSAGDDPAAERVRQPLAERRRILRRFQNLLFDRREEAARLVNRENGKPTVEAMLTDVAVSLDVMRYYLRHAHRILRPQRLTHSNLAVFGKRGWIFWDPVGVVSLDPSVPSRSTRPLVSMSMNCDDTPSIHGNENVRS